RNWLLPCSRCWRDGPGRKARTDRPPRWWSFFGKGTHLLTPANWVPAFAGMTVDSGRDDRGGSTISAAPPPPRAPACPPDRPADRLGIPRANPAPGHARAA